jgi:leucyl/phenylalanyl-tRNA--protein transferase
VQTRRSKSRVIEVDFLLAAYCSGYFPMAEPLSGEIGWYSPDPRAIIDLDEFNIPRSLKLTIKKGVFDIRINERFEEVIRACGQRKETWISEEIIQSYVQLHRVGFAHSVECWHEGTLAGGLYGVALRGAFFGESMFSRVRDSSKVALVHLVERMRERGYVLLDTQFLTPHLARFGAKEIPRAEYLERLKSALVKSCHFVNQPTSSY